MANEWQATLITTFQADATDTFSWVQFICQKKERCNFPQIRFFIDKWNCVLMSNSIALWYHAIEFSEQRSDGSSLTQCSAPSFRCESQRKVSSRCRKKMSAWGPLKQYINKKIVKRTVVYVFRHVFKNRTHKWWTTTIVASDGVCQYTWQLCACVSMGFFSSGKYYKYIRAQTSLNIIFRPFWASKHLC